MPVIQTENIIVRSGFLGRDVKIDFFFPRRTPPSSPATLLLINDGQNMRELDLAGIMEHLYVTDQIAPVFCAAIHAGLERKMEYGTAIQADYLGRGARAGSYTRFVLAELMPVMRRRFPAIHFGEKAFAGFSLGGLMALDIVWNHPEEFTRAGIFSGSLWWRSLDDKSDEYDDELHRIMHQQIKMGSWRRHLKFFFTTGSFDETDDRNNNGVIDSIDDTISLIHELELLGYRNETDIRYINYDDGRHDLSTWARAMPEFLKWGWGKPRV